MDITLSDPKRNANYKKFEKIMFKDITLKYIFVALKYCNIISYFFKILSRIVNFVVQTLRATNA